MQRRIIISRKNFLLAASGTMLTIVDGACSGHTSTSPDDAAGGKGGTGAGSVATGGSASGSGGASGTSGSGGASGTSGSGGASGTSGSGGASVVDSGPPPDCLVDGPAVQFGFGNHGHVLLVPAADVQAGASKSYDIRGTADHTHTVNILDFQFEQLLTTGVLTVTSTRYTDNHYHTIGLTCLVVDG
jgi:hypothetical protein